MRALYCKRCMLGHIERYFSAGEIRGCICALRIREEILKGHFVYTERMENVFSFNWVTLRDMIRVAQSVIRFSFKIFRRQYYGNVGN